MNITNSLLSLVICLASLLTAYPGFCQSHDRITLGVPTSLTLLEGRESLNAVRLAVEEINSRGGVQVGGGKLLLHLESVDLRDGLPGVDPSQVLGVLDGFLKEKKVHALVVGPFRSEVLLAGLDMIARRRIPLLGSIAMSPATEALVMKNTKYKYIFRVCLDSKYLVGYIIKNLKFLRERFGFDKVFIMNQDVAWARSTASLTMKLYLNRQGWKILGQENYPGAASDFSSGLKEARAKGAQVILCIFDSPQSGHLVRQWHLMEVPAMLSGFISPMTGPSAWREFDGKIAGATNVVFELGNIPSVKYRPADSFYRAYKKRYGREIEAGHGPAPSYESVYVLAEAITRAGSLEPDAIVTQLEKTDRRGVMGRLRFHKGHQVFFGNDPEKDALACLMQWTRDGRRKIIYPAPIAEGDIELPSFVRP